MQFYNLSTAAYLCQVFTLHSACWTRVAYVAHLILAWVNALFFSPSSPTSFLYIDTGQKKLRCDAMRWAPVEHDEVM